MFLTPACAHHASLAPEFSRLHTPHTHGGPVGCSLLRSNSSPSRHVHADGFSGNGWALVSKVVGESIPIHPRARTSSLFFSSLDARAVAALHTVPQGQILKWASNASGISLCPYLAASELASPLLFLGLGLSPPLVKTMMLSL
jgi:hypothetical protein